MKKCRLLFLVFLVGVSIAPSFGAPVARADSVSVQNTVTVSSQTGGNGTGGATQDGNARAQVSLTTEVNGEVVVREEETKTGSSASIEKNVIYQNGKTTIEVSGTPLEQESPSDARENDGSERNSGAIDGEKESTQISPPPSEREISSGIQGFLNGVAALFEERLAVSPPRYILLAAIENAFLGFVPWKNFIDHVFFWIAI